MRYAFPQQLLTTALAMGLGASLMASSADGYPASSSISYGANPVMSVGGSFTGSGFTATHTPIVATDDHDFVVTDVVLGIYMNSGSLCGADVRLQAVVGGDVVGRFVIPHGDSNRGKNGTNVRLSSGIRIPKGQAIELSIPGRTYACGSDSNWTVDYTLSGYHAHQ